ncbi:hypothetical protein ACGFIF_43000 [Kribbella sp. NPDC049174]|uniref:hypothetical protein n=1 Tax=Kribbella sp. NPDC049174 TaxID=3364112 RepID=UPI003716B6D8
MRVYGHPILANGLRTDHPLPGLPFVDDSHIPIEDPDAVEAVGREREEGMWGRTDRCLLRTPTGNTRFGDKAFTTEPSRHDLAWLVRFHPEFGRTIMLVADSDAASLYADLRDELLLWRAGGYWWDGTTWWRPAQLFDMTTETYVRRAVPGAATVSAAATLNGEHSVTRVKILTVDDIQLDAEPLDRYDWLQHLATWAQHRPADGLPLEQCVVDVTAPELAGNQLLSLNQTASVAGITAGTLRGYISRGENDVPDPQMVIGGRSMWSRPVVHEWIETRAYTPEESSRAVSHDFGEGLAAGVADLREKISYWILSRLSRSPEIKPRFALRWRDQQSFQQVAIDLSGTIAANLDQIVPLDHLARTILDAMRGDVLEQYDLDTQLERTNQQRENPRIYHISDDTGLMLDWLIRHHPRLGRFVVQTFVGDLERENDRYQTSRDMLLHTLKVALGPGKLTAEQVESFLRSAIMPSSDPAGS